MPVDGKGRAVWLLKPDSFAVSTFPPLSLMALAAWLRERGHAVRILDLGYPEDRDQLQALADTDRPLLFGVTATTPEFSAAARLVRALKARHPHVPVVLGGVHVSALGPDALAEAGAEFGVCGEGEETLTELVAALQAGADVAALSAIRGLVWKQGASFVVNPPRPVLDDVDTLPMPAWDLVPAERYISKPFGILQKRPRTGFVVTSRGCPFACTFCAHEMMGKTFRGRSALRVVDEIEVLYRDYGVRELLIVEDNFTFDRGRAAAICEEILRRGLDIAWRTPNGVRIDSLDAPLVALMKRSGCYLLGFGIESADRDVLRRARKPLDLDAVARTVALVRQHGILTFGTFILGWPGETRASVLETIRYAASLELDIAHYGLYAPYPGSHDFEEMRDRPGLRDWDRYLAFEALPCSDLPPAELKALLRRAYADFYLRPARLRLYARMLGPAQLWAAARTLYHYVA